MTASTEVVQALEEFRSGLEADGYTLSVAEDGSKVLVRIDAGPDACKECLIPKDLMLQMMQSTPPLDARELELRYPTDD